MIEPGNTSYLTSMKAVDEAYDKGCEHNLNAWLVWARLHHRAAYKLSMATHEVDEVFDLLLGWVGGMPAFPADAHVELRVGHVRTSRRLQPLPMPVGVPEPQNLQLRSMVLAVCKFARRTSWYSPEALDGFDLRLSERP